MQWSTYHPIDACPDFGSDTASKLYPGQLEQSKVHHADVRARSAPHQPRPPNASTIALHRGLNTTSNLKFRREIEISPALWIEDAASYPSSG